MSVLAVPVVLVLLVLVIGGVAVMRLARNQRERENRAKSPGLESLRYRVPEGQDPAAVVTALQREGFEPVQDSDTGGEDLLIPCPAGLDRERARVRATIQDASLNLEGDPSSPTAVRFSDE